LLITFTFLLITTIFRLTELMLVYSTLLKILDQSGVNSLFYENLNTTVIYCMLTTWRRQTTFWWRPVHWRYILQGGAK